MKNLILAFILVFWVVHHYIPSRGVGLYFGFEERTYEIIEEPQCYSERVWKIKLMLIYI